MYLSCFKAKLKAEPAEILLGTSHAYGSLSALPLVYILNSVLQLVLLENSAFTNPYYSVPIRVSFLAFPPPIFSPLHAEELRYSFLYDVPYSNGRTERELCFTENYPSLTLLYATFLPLCKGSGSR